MAIDRRELGKFLASLERRAFLMARIATGEEQEALDLVQDSMLRMVHRYGHKPATQWKALFYRILQNRIRDWHRRTAVRRRWRVWLRLPMDEGKGGQGDPLENLADPHGVMPDEAAVEEEARQHLVAALMQLPQRQQQALMLRFWEGLSVAEAARAMDCSKGSIKTHTARGMQTLRQKLVKIENEPQ